MKITKKDAFLAMKAFPQYRGPKFFLNIANTVTFHDVNWGGGTKNTYVAVELKDNGAVNTLPTPAPWMNPMEGKTVQIPAGWVVVEHSVFCGHECGLTIYVTEADGWKPLSAPKN